MPWPWYIGLVHLKKAWTPAKHYEMICCRLGVALQGWCNVECEDQLQHTISSHLDVQHASQLVDVDTVRGSALLHVYTGPADQIAAAYLHLQLAGVIDKYSQKQQHRRWFDTYEF